MNTKRKVKRTAASQDEVDRIVELQVNDDSAWEEPIQIRKKKPKSVSISASLAARAAFLARLHREKNVEDWLSRIIRERVELEESALSRAKRELASHDGA